jgi:hypothetical protein
MKVNLKLGYFVDIDTLNHTLKQHVEPKIKEDGTLTKQTEKVIGYYPNMMQAIRGAKRDVIANDGSEKSFDQWLEMASGLEL